MLLPFPGRPAPDRPILLLVGRDNWYRSHRMNSALLRGLRGRGVDIRWEDPAGEWIHRLRLAEQRFHGLPERLRAANLKLVRLLYGLLHWGYFRYLRRPRTGLENRCANLRRRIAGLGRGRRLLVLAYSSGGRASSLIADALPVSRVICLGYPFRAPGAGDEPGRYAHLAGLRTPMLILQGVHDEYGGLDVPETYRLSPSIDLEFIDSDHGYDLRADEWDRVLGRIRSAIADAAPAAQ